MLTLKKAGNLLIVILWTALLCGCASAPPQVGSNLRSFDFAQDTFSFANELVWEYSYDANGKWRAHRRQLKPDYTLHCFVVARSVAQFFLNARFAPEQPLAHESTYRELIRRVVRSNPRQPLPDSKKIVIPGYANLRQFSRAQEPLLKAECGSAWQSYSQRGNWRMIFPLTRHQQERTAGQLVAHLKIRGLAVVHLVKFPRLTINHGVVVFAARETPSEIEFNAYDPNQPAAPITLTFERQTQTFLFGPNHYFPGGPVNVYEIYHRWDY